MVTWRLTFFPILEVLIAGGSIKLSELAEKLEKTEPTRFRDLEYISRGIDTYCGCLCNDGDRVRFNREATQYAKFLIMERSI